MAKHGGEGKGKSPVEMAGELAAFVQWAAAEGKPLREVERGAFDRLLRMGRAMVGQFIALQGNGDRGRRSRRATA